MMLSISDYSLWELFKHEIIQLSFVGFCLLKRLAFVIDFADEYRYIVRDPKFWNFGFELWI